MICIGIDPGRHGAFAAVLDREVLLLADLPYRGGDLDAYSLRHLVKAINGAYPISASVVVEAQVSSMGGKGAAGANTTIALTNYGRILGCIESLGYTVDTPMPRTWQAKILKGIPGVGKERSVFWARRSYPDAELFGPRGGVLDGRADALCLAEYARIVGVGR